MRITRNKLSIRQRQKDKLTDRDKHSNVTHIQKTRHRNKQIKRKTHKAVETKNVRKYKKNVFKKTRKCSTNSFCLDVSKTLIYIWIFKKFKELRTGGPTDKVNNRNRIAVKK